MLKKTVVMLCAMLTTALLSACQQPQSSNKIKVGTIAGPETQLMEVAKKVAQDCYGLTVKIITFTDYNMPNAALSDGSIGANMFQHTPFLEAQKKARGYDIVAVGKAFIYPMGIYSKSLTSLDQLKPGAKVAIPNDPSNEARALLLLQQAHLIILKPGKGFFITSDDIMTNDKHLKFIELDAAQLARVLPDVALAVINTNYAIPAGLSPSKALFAEAADSPYANVVVVRDDDENSLKVKELVAALHSKAVLAAAKRIFGDAAIPAWNLNAPLLPCSKKAATT